MEDFFKQFRTNWQNRPEPLFDEKDWLALQKKLNRHKTRQHLAVFPWRKFGIPLFLTLSISNIVFFSAWDQSRQALKTIEKQRDTIWMACVEYQTDTLFLERPAPQKIGYIWPADAVCRPGYAGRPLFDLPLPAFPKEDDAAASVLSPALETPTGKNKIGGMAEKTIPSNSNWSNFKPLALPPSRFSTVANPLPLLQTVVPIQAAGHKKNLKQTLYALRPKTFAAGITGGWSYPVQQGVQAQSGYSAGISASVGFSSHIWLWAHAGYFNTHFRAERMGDDLGIPVVQAPSDDFTFQEAEASLPALDYAVGLAWYFRTTRRFQPLVGAGFGQLPGLPYEITYDFIKASEGIEWSIDKQVNPQGPPPGFLLARTGFDYEIFEHWHWQATATYRASLDKTSRYFPQIWDLQTGLLYRF